MACSIWPYGPADHQSFRKGSQVFPTRPNAPQQPLTAPHRSDWVALALLPILYIIGRFSRGPAPPSRPPGPRGPAPASPALAARPPPTRPPRTRRPAARPPQARAPQPGPCDGTSLHPCQANHDASIRPCQPGNVRFLEASDEASIHPCQPVNVLEARGIFRIRACLTWKAVRAKRKSS